MSLLKVRYIDLPEDQKAIVRGQHAAMTPFIQRRTVGFFDEPKCFFGSGTLVQHRGRFFVATADHVAQQVQERFDSVSLFYGAAPAEQRGPRIDHSVRSLGAVVRRRQGRPPRVDVAAVELPSSIVPELRPMEFTESRNVMADGVAEAGTNVWIVGTPTAVRAAEQAAEGSTNLETFGVLITHLRGGCPAAHDQDGKDDGYGSPPESDLHVEWTEALWASREWAALPAAGGMSGGGVWACRAPQEEVWSADRALLLGIPWYQRRDIGCIRATTMSHWSSGGHSGGRHAASPGGALAGGCVPKAS